MKIKRKNKMLILGTSLLGLGTIVGIGCNSFINKNNSSNEISYIQMNRQDDSSTTSDNPGGNNETSNPELGEFYFIYDCTSGTTYDYNNNTDYSSIGDNDILVTFYLSVEINVSNSVNQPKENNLLFLTMRPTDLDSDTYSQYFDGQSNYIQPFTDYINGAIKQVFESTDKQINNQPFFDLCISNLSISWEADPDSSSDGSGGYFMTLTYDISNNYLNDLNNEKNNNNQLNQTVNNKNNQINGLNNTQIALIVVLLIFIIITFILIFLIYRNKRRAKD